MAHRIEEPISDEEIEELREEIQAQREEVRKALAEDLGGNPEDYRAETYLAGKAADN